VVAVAEQEPLSDLAQQYLNRLSDLLFVLARTINQALGYTDTYWQKI
jgi:cob(I)alamin adenosyltransferase